MSDDKPMGESAEPVAYRWLRNGETATHWANGRPSARQFEAAAACKDFAEWTVSYAYAHPPARSDEPSAEHWRRAVEEFRSYGNIDDADAIEQCANELAKEGK